MSESKARNTSAAIHIHQAALQAPEPETPKQQGRMRGKQQMSILRMGAHQIQSAAA